VRDVMRHLQQVHGTSGKTERVSRVLRASLLKHAHPPVQLPSPPPDVTELLARLRAAEARAERAEELERSHQDFWARRYDQQLEELERQKAALKRAPSSGVSAEKYLRVCQRAAELARRLAEYEPVEPFVL
jgi:hypothetical protein